MKIFNSEEFIREKYMKIKTTDDLFDDFVQNLVEYVTGFYAIKKKYELQTTNEETNLELGKVNPVEYYGVKTRVENTTKGGKFVVEFDNQNSLHAYPVCDDNYDRNEIGMPIPLNATVDFYFVSNGKTTKLATGLDANLVLAPNQKRFWGNSKRWEERNTINKLVKDEIYQCGIARKYKSLNTELEKEGETYLEQLNAKREASRVEWEEYNKQKEKNKVRVSKGVVLEFAKNGIPFEPGCTYKFKNWFDIGFAKPPKRGEKPDTTPSVCVAALTLQLLKEYCRNELEIAFANKRHPDASDIDDFIAKYKKYIYTPRALKEDNYLLVDYFKNQKRDIPCQHCGKKDIVNVMVIEAPDKKRYLVGSDCVFHLVKLSWDEFEEKWNKPFTMAQRIQDTLNKDAKMGWVKNWYVQKNDNGEDTFVYIATKDALLDSEWFYIPDISRSSNYKPLRRESHTKILSEGFMKRMLPREYVKAIYTNVDMPYVLDCIYPSKEMMQYGYKKFSFGGVDYNFNTFEYINRIKLPETSETINIGEFKITIENDNGLPKIETKFRDYTYTLKYTEYTDED